MFINLWYFNFNNFNCGNDTALLGNDFIWKAIWEVFSPYEIVLSCIHLRIVSTLKIVVSFQFHFKKENFSLSVF